MPKGRRHALLLLEVSCLGAFAFALPCEAQGSELLISCGEAREH